MRKVYTLSQNISIAIFLSSFVLHGCWLRCDPEDVVYVDFASLKLEMSHSNEDAVTQDEKL